MIERLVGGDVDAQGLPVPNRTGVACLRGNPPVISSNLGMGMARHSAIEEPSNTASDPLGRSAPNGGAQAGRDAHRILIRAQLLRGDIATALAAAQHLTGQKGRHDAVDLLIDVALEHGQRQLARSVLAEAEAAIPAAQAAQLKARIAVSEGDLEAAKAILVMAIEADPDATPLRTLLAEVMVAAGTAADALAVLSTLGAAPVNPPAEDEIAPETDLRPEPEKRIG
jgi:hypothetical protein